MWNKKTCYILCIFLISRNIVHYSCGSAESYDDNINAILFDHNYTPCESQKPNSNNQDNNQIIIKETIECDKEMTELLPEEIEILKILNENKELSDSIWDEIMKENQNEIVKSDDNSIFPDKKHPLIMYYLQLPNPPLPDNFKKQTTKSELNQTKNCGTTEKQTPNLEGTSSVCLHIQDLNLKINENIPKNNVSFELVDNKKPFDNKRKIISFKLNDFIRNIKKNTLNPGTERTNTLKTNPIKKHRNIYKTYEKSRALKILNINNKSSENKSENKNSDG